MATVEHRELRGALEFAVLIAAEGSKRRPPLAVPRELKPFLGQRRLPTNRLGRVRRIVESNPEFRQALSAGAVPELVDEVGRLWLAGEPGWEQRAAEIVAARADDTETSDARQEVKRADKRRAAAERSAARAQVELLQRDDTIAQQAVELDELRAELAKADDEVAELRVELIDTRNEVRHARDREAAAVARAERLESDREGESSASQRAGADSAAAELADVRRRLAEVSDAAQEFAERLEALLPGTGAHASSPTLPPTRVPLTLPGGVSASSGEAARHLVRQRAPVFVDGYNVSKRAWSDRVLVEQREELIGRCENLARRCGADVTIVFDGDSIAGAHAPGRRSVRVVYSPSGTTADDVIRAEVSAVPQQRAVVVVTDDREIVADVKRDGANVIPTDAFIGIL